MDKLRIVTWIAALVGCAAPWVAHAQGNTDPCGVAVDALDNVHIADTGNERVLKLAPDGAMTTIAGLLPAEPQ